MSQINGRSSSRPPARQCVAKCLLKVWQADDSPCPDKLVVSPLGPYLPFYSALCPACIRTGAPLQPPSLFLSSYPLPELVLAPLILIVFPSRDFGLLQSPVQIPFSLCTVVWRSLELTLCRTQRTLTNACSGSSFHRHLPDALTFRIAAEESQFPNALDPQFSASPASAW